MGRKTSHARLVQRKTGAAYQVSLMKIRDLRELGPEAMTKYMNKVRALPDSPILAREHVICVHCLSPLSKCDCHKSEDKT